jgi:hypothetical protein
MCFWSLINLLLLIFWLPIIHSSLMYLVSLESKSLQVALTFKDSAKFLQYTQ